MFTRSLQTVDGAWGGIRLNLVSRYAKPAPGSLPASTVLGAVVVVAQSTLVTQSMLVHSTAERATCPHLLGTLCP